MGKKRVKVLLKVPDNVSKKTVNYIEDDLKEQCKNENVSVEKISYFVASLFRGSRLIVYLLLHVLAALLQRKQMIYLNSCDKVQKCKDVNLAKVYQCIA